MEEVALLVAGLSGASWWGCNRGDARTG